VFSRLAVINEGSTVCQLWGGPRVQPHLSRELPARAGVPFTRDHARDGRASPGIRSIHVRTTRQQGARVVFVATRHGVKELRVDRRRAVAVAVAAARAAGRLMGRRGRDYVGHTHEKGGEEDENGGKKGARRGVGWMMEVGEVSGGTDNNASPQGTIIPLASLL
jgi:hypothetical protein